VVDPRRISSLSTCVVDGDMAVQGDGLVSDSIRSNNLAMPISAISIIGCRTVVNAGEQRVASGASSKPLSAMS